MKRILANLIDGLLVAMIIAYIILWLSGGGIAVVSGRSMEPTLHTGDIVLFVSTSVDELEEGDVVIYRDYRTGNLVIHRIIFKYETESRTCFVIQGDNNPVPDVGDSSLCPPIHGASDGLLYVHGIPQEWIKGEVVRVYGYVLKIPYVGVIALIARGLVG